MSDQPTAQPSDEVPGLTDDQQRTMDGVQHAIDDAKQAEVELREVDADAIDEPGDRETGSAAREA